ncbi:MAG: pilus assembly protein PilC [Comamonadaceae bacterium]|nr:MAG: pilus assembly protein PilC [Comamonadaceae bacterium]
MNYDKANPLVPPGSQFGRIYRDLDTQTTIADWAMKSWYEPLQHPNHLEGRMTTTPEYDKAPNTQTYTNRVTKASATLTKYWDPHNNPATWPHMVTHTVGFSSDALLTRSMDANKDADDVLHPTQMIPYGTDGHFADYANGTYTWWATEDKGQDMWHAAINGRGRFYAVENGDDLAHAFRSIVERIHTEVPVAGHGSIAASGSNITRQAVNLFTAHYDPAAAWKGWITSQTVSPAGSVAATAGWQGKSTAERIDAMRPADRVILGWRDANGSAAAAGVPFVWAADGSHLSPEHQTALAGPDDQGERRLNYLRGDRSGEGTAAGKFRVRQSAHGDIVNSQIWYTAAPAHNYPLPGYAAFYTGQRQRTPMVYVGANDGMLHGFSAQDGTEKIAYVPRGVVPRLAQLTAQTYGDNHRYFVDGSPMTGDAKVAFAPGASAEWRTMLVGTLGAGGKGFFVLDVTQPGDFSARNADRLVVMDKTLGPAETLGCVPHTTTSVPPTGQTSCLQVPEADLGHITATPVRDDANPLRATQITRMNNDRWAVVLGNGYNSTNQRPVLLIQYLDGDKELLRIPATGSAATGGANTTDNGLSAPRLVDINGDGRPDVAYAGDNQGNLWKFIIASSEPAQWGVAFSGSPLFTARGPALASSSTRDRVQPISTAPIVRANDRSTTTGSGTSAKNVAVGGMMVAFGTGRNVARTDPADTSVQSLYSVLDNTRYTITTTTTTTGTGTGDSARQQVAVHPGCSDCDNGQPVPEPAALGTGVARLAKQVIGSTEFKGSGSKADRSFWTVDQTGPTSKPSVDWNSHKGWYLDLPVSGERLLKPLELYDGSHVLAAYTQVPARAGGTGASGASGTAGAESCSAPPVPVSGERQFLTLINLIDGRRPQVQLMDKNGDGLYTAADDGVSRMSLASGAQIRLTQGQKEINKGAGDRDDVLARMPIVVLRPSWRHLQ